MLGTAWVDEDAYLKPPLSRLQAALCSRIGRSSEDPSSKKLSRWLLERRQHDEPERSWWEDELHCTWVDELTLAGPAAKMDNGAQDDCHNGAGTGGDEVDDDTEELVRIF